MNKESIILEWEKKKKSLVEKKNNNKLLENKTNDALLINSKLDKVDIETTINNDYLIGNNSDKLNNLISVKSKDLIDNTNNNNLVSIKSKDLIHKETKKNLTGKNKLLDNNITNPNINLKPSDVIKNYNKSTPLINIITRTSKRPNYFLECYSTIIRQSYPNIRHIIGYDDKQSLNYILKNKPIKNNIFFVQSLEKRTERSHMPYNLYMNELMKYIDEGWIINMDDDDIFVNIESISILVSYIKNDDQLLIWKTKNNGKILPSDKSFKKKPIRGDITSNSYMFHSKYKNYAIWDNKAGSDFRVLEKLMKLNLKIVWINSILTKVNNIDGMGRGNQIDKHIEKINRDKLISINQTYSDYRNNIYNKNDYTEINDDCQKEWIENFFDKIYLLNLDRRKDRYNNMKLRLKNNHITKFERFSAIDGKDKQIEIDYFKYQVGNFNQIDTKLGRKGIPSAGSWAILLSMKNMINDALNKNYNNILVLQDDVFFIKNFKLQLTNLMNQIKDIKWKLLYLGCSNHHWFKFNSNHLIYKPLGFCDGAFAVAIHRSIFREILNEIKMVLPFDSGPLKTIQMRYRDDCLVFNPNLIIADVSDSDCRKKRSQTTFAKKFGWDLRLYNFDSFTEQNKKLNTGENIKNNLVSVIITSYNSSKYIYAAVSSIINQTYTNLEIIIIDDFSTDNTYKILTNLKNMDNRIKLLQNDKNYGTYVSKNIGILISKGQYITFHDSDDYSITNRIEKQLLFLTNNSSYSACNCCFFSRSKSKKNELVPAEITLFIKRNVIKQLGFFDSVRVGADTEYRRRLQIAKIKIGIINEYLYTCLDRFMESNNIGKNTSLTSCNKLGTNSNIRSVYRSSFTNYHKNKSVTFYMPFPQFKRVFPINYLNKSDKVYFESNLSNNMINLLIKNNYIIQ